MVYTGSFYGEHRIPDPFLVVHVVGEIPHRDVAMVQQDATVLLLIIGTGEGQAILTGKIFEYLGARRPILALVPPDGEAADVITRTATGTVLAPQDIPAIANTLHVLYQQWQGQGITYTPNCAEAKQYSRIEQARQLADLFSEILSQRCR